MIGEITPFDDLYQLRRNVVRYSINGVKSQKGISVMSEDWDNLIILDACRNDLFEKEIDLNRFDEYERKISKGSLTPEWAEKNFGSGVYPDTVYVSANPWISQKAGGSFHRLEEIWKENFDEKLNTVPPNIVAEKAVNEFQSDKRMIVHFMQPHPPFIGRGDEPLLETDGLHWSPDHIEGKEDREVFNVWHGTGRGILDKDEVWEAYRQSLSYVSDIALRLVEDIPGKSVITSDHGILFGDRQMFPPIKGYGHPRGVRHPKLVTVPWGVLEDGRREIKAGDTTVSVEASDEVEERLKQFGYIDEV